MAEATYNKVILMGRLTRDPEIRSAGGAKVASFSVATTDTWKDGDGQRQERNQYHPVAIWNQALIEAVVIAIHSRCLRLFPFTHCQARYPLPSYRVIHGIPAQHHRMRTARTRRAAATQDKTVSARGVNRVRTCSGLAYTAVTFLQWPQLA
jgi:Single-strand binding protein family